MLRPPHGKYWHFSHRDLAEELSWPFGTCVSAREMNNIPIGLSGVEVGAAGRRGILAPSSSHGLGITKAPNLAPRETSEWRENHNQLNTVIWAFSTLN